ncbi:MAG: hypothetical protein V7709_06360 [Halioglobus sp.]
MLNNPGMALAAAIVASLLNACSFGRAYPVTELYVNTQPEAMPLSPVVVIPGFLGSVMIDRDSGEVVWGRFLAGQQASFRDDVQRRIALPMTGAPTLSELRDAVEPVHVMGNAEVALGSGSITVNAYPGMVSGMMIGAASDNPDKDIPSKAKLRKWVRDVEDEPSLTDPTRPVAFDWRRDLTGEVQRLEKVIDRAYQEKIARGHSAEQARVDVVAHSLGSLLVRYYLRYGTQSLPADGSAPVLDWRGAHKVRRAILVGPPNNGALDSLYMLAEGGKPLPLLLATPPPVIGSFVSMYQLMPHRNSMSVVSASDGSPIDIYDVETWDKLSWGLLDRKPASEKVLKNLMPDIDTPQQRREAAKKYLALCLESAVQLHRALDIPASPPAGTSLHLFASNTIDTEGVAVVDTDSGEFVDVIKVPGDGRVTRKSALGNTAVNPNLSQPIEPMVDWASVHFVPGEHFGFVDHPVFTNNLMYLLLQAP